MIAVVYAFLAERADRNDERMFQAGQESTSRIELDNQFALSEESDEEVDSGNVIALSSWAAMANQGMK